MLSPTYFECLIEAIANRGIADILDPRAGTLSVFLPKGRTLYLTPGWWGEALSWCVEENDYGEVEASGSIEAPWTGIIDSDVALYVSELRRLRKEVS